MSNLNTLSLICDMVSLINSEDFEATIPALAESCNIPVEYTRKFILRLLNNNVLSTCINGEDPTSYENEDTFIDEYYDNKQNVTNKLLQGKYDHYIWNLELKILSPDEDQLLGLAPLEYGAIQSLGEFESSFIHGAIFETKDNITKIGKNIRKNQEIIQTAITNHTAISFCYKDRKGTIEIHSGFPIRLATSIADNWIYFELANTSSTYRLDRVTDTIKVNKNLGAFPKIEVNPNRKYMWGSYFDENAEPVHVKIAISDTRPNMIQKIKNDIRHREGLCSFYERDNVYYYEDDIIGISEFRRWLRGYGSSIQVIEPIDQRNQIIEAAKRTLSLYDLSEAWGDL